MVGRQLRQLEEALGARLLLRDTRKQSLTEAGELFYRHAKEILASVARAQEALLDVDDEPRGKLRVAAPVSLGSSMIAPLIASYQQRFAKVDIELVLGNGMVDLIDGGFDLAIRVGALPDSTMVARPLRPYRNLICASPAYLARAGVPQTWEDLRSHRCLVHQAWQASWTAQDGGLLSWPMQQAFSANDGYALRAAAIAGAGLVLQPEVLLADAIQNGDLVAVLGNYVPPGLPVHLLYLRDPFSRRRLASLVDFLIGELG